MVTEGSVLGHSGFSQGNSECRALSFRSGVKGSGGSTNGLQPHHCHGGIYAVSGIPKVEDVEQAVVKAGAVGDYQFSASPAQLPL